MKRPPCIRGLKEFKKGCPQRKWDGGEGCPAWLEDWVVVKGEREWKGMCVDIWLSLYMRFSLGLMEGAQIAAEGNRNMTALFSLVSLKQKNPSELIRVAKKHLGIGNDNNQRSDQKNIEQKMA